MKKVIVIAMTMVALLAVDYAQADVCEIVNGSFEDDGPIDFPPEPNEPNGWDVNVPAGEFYGYIHSDWPTEGLYNLTFYTNYFNTFEVNDTAMVSQELDLTDVNEIIFDLKLETDSLTWDPSKARAIVLVDDDVVWNSNELSSGEHPNEVYIVENKYRDGAPHTLSFGIRVIVAERLWRTYYTDWDYIECTYYELIPGDFNRDLCVDFLDLAMLANYWGETAPPEYDLAVDGIIDLNDLDIFVEDWLVGSCE